MQVKKKPFWSPRELQVFADIGRSVAEAAFCRPLPASSAPPLQTMVVPCACGTHRSENHPSDAEIAAAVAPKSFVAHMLEARRKDVSARTVDQRRRTHSGPTDAELAEAIAPKGLAGHFSAARRAQ